MASTFQNLEALLGRETDLAILLDRHFGGSVVSVPAKLDRDTRRVRASVPTELADRLRLLVYVAFLEGRALGATDMRDEDAEVVARLYASRVRGIFGGVIDDALATEGCNYSEEEGF